MTAFVFPECARRAIYLAPRKFKGNVTLHWFLTCHINLHCFLTDIPLLSLGTILQRSSYINDSVIVTTAAVDHAHNVPENLWSLGNGFLMLSQFNKSLEYFHKVEKIDSAYSLKVDFIKKSINCFRDLKITLITMEK